jgi:hypothetical protein
MRAEPLATPMPDDANESPKERNPAYWQRVNELAERIRPHFEGKGDVQRRFHTPSEEECRVFAQSLLLIEIGEKVRRRPPERKRIAAVRAGRDFLAALAAAKPEIKRAAEWAPWDGPGRATLRKMDRLAARIEVLLSQLYGSPRDPVVFLAERAQAA